MTQKRSMRGSALGLTLLLMAMPVHAFEPMPPIMQKLLEVFPEEDGRFVDEPFGSTAEMPSEARPLFETFRVVVPTVEDLDKNLAHLFAASSHFPIKKITRYDRDPGAPGLTGFRGAWCQTEDEDQVGFSIVTINQNRFLIWAKMGYYPAFANDSINPKVRDQYARDVSQYLAGIDFKVPDNEAPLASGRGLPEGMELLDPLPAPWSSGTPSPSLLVSQIEELTCWGLSEVNAVVPTSALLAKIIADAKDTLFANKDLALIQDEYQDRVHYDPPVSAHITNFTQELFRTMHHGGAYTFAMDRYGRIRICKFPGEGDDGIPDALLFPASPVLSAGVLNIRHSQEWESTDPPRITSLVCNFSAHFWSWSMWSASADNAKAVTDLQLRAFGHFLSRMRELGIAVDNVLIRKHDLFW